MQFLADTFSLIVDPCYALTHNWWLAILLFTIIIKIILMPMALWVQKNSIVMVQLMPALNRIKIRYFGDAETIGEKQTALYKEKRYHPMLSLIPLAIQVIILFGLVDVVHSITDSGTPGTEFLGPFPSRTAAWRGSCRCWPAFPPWPWAAPRTSSTPCRRSRRASERTPPTGFPSPLVLLGHVCRRRHGLLLDVLESALHRDPDRLQRHHQAGEVHRLRRPRRQPRGTGGPERHRQEADEVVPARPPRQAREGRFQAVLLHRRQAHRLLLGGQRLLQVLQGRHRMAARPFRCRHPLRDERPQRPGVHAGGNPAEPDSLLHRARSAPSRS